MGYSLSLYLGPIVEVRRFASAPRIAIDLRSERLSNCHPMGDTLEKVGEITWRICRFIPNMDRPGQPEHLHISGDKEDAFIDLSDRLMRHNPRAELTWFQEQFNRELQELRELFGVEPVVRWGLLKECS